MRHTREFANRKDPITNRQRTIHCFVLLQTGFAPQACYQTCACALTARFHPYLGDKPRRYSLCGTFRRLTPPLLGRFYSINESVTPCKASHLLEVQTFLFSPCFQGEKRLPRVPKNINVIITILLEILIKIDSIEQPGVKNQFFTKKSMVRARVIKKRLKNSHQ